MEVGHMKEKEIETKTKLMEFSTALEFRYGSGEISSFLYAITKMHRPRVIVELGTGYGVSTFWMAQALKENKLGHIWSVDNLENLTKSFEESDTEFAGLKKTSLSHLTGIAPSKFYKSASDALGLAKYISFLKRNINLKEPRSLLSFPFSSRKVDLLFSDISHEPDDILGVFAFFLPRMSIASSIFIDSASTCWPSYFCVENVVAMLNSGSIPSTVEEWLSSKQKSQVLARKYSLIHLTYKGNGATQNSTAWIKIQPKDARPYPLAEMWQS
jgi:hypothetical protein